MADRIRYYRVNGCNAFWAPGKQAASLSLPKSQPLGPDSADARVAAIRWNERLDEARANKDKPARRTYPAGTLGHFYERFRAKTAWKLMQPRTREDYERAWPIIEARFGHTVITRISADDSERFHAEVHPAHNADSDFGVNEAHRILKIWRALMNALVSYELRRTAPIGRVANPAPRGREGLWVLDDVLRLSWAACVLGMPGMAIAIRVAWSGMLSPVDVWKLPREAWQDGLIRHNRTRTHKRILVRVDAETTELVNAYLATQPISLPSAPLIRRANGGGYRSKDTFGDDFRAVRALAFPGDARQFLDLRRSGATEARRGGATRDDLGKAMANRVDISEALAATYFLEASDRVQEARATARRKANE